MTGAKFDIKKFDRTGDFGLWRFKMCALLIQHGYKAALEVLPTDMEAEPKAELNKKVYSAVILCLGNKILKVSQSRYVSKILNNFRIDNGKSVQMPLGGHFKLSLKDYPVRDCDVERMSKVPYANAVGSLMYLMVCMRPDIAYAVSVVSRYLANPGFVDSDYAMDPDKGRSITGYAFLVQGCVVSWKATLQHVMALSTTEAEYMALTEAVKEAIWLRGLLEELGVVLEVNTVKVMKVGTEHNAADALTKVVAGRDGSSKTLLGVVECRCRIGLSDWAGRWAFQHRRDNETAFDFAIRSSHVILSQEHPSEEGTSRKGSDQGMSAADPGALNQGVAAPSHLRRRVRKEKRCSKGWKKVCSTGSEIKEKVCPCTQTTQGVDHTTVATETLKAATNVLVQKQRNPFSRDVITKGRPRRKRRSCQKVKVAPEETIDSYDDLKKAFLENYLRQKKCIKDPIEIHNIRQRDGESTEEFMRRSSFHSPDLVQYLSYWAYPTIT
ncbi:hypothetical protein Tco_0574256 [Tanacetum coccineum]